MQFLKTENDVLEALSASRHAPIAIYKHSPICGLSDSAIVEFRKFMADDAGRFSCYQVDVISARAASMKIEQVLGVRHESPQVLMIRNSECLWHGSHRSVKAERLKAGADSFLNLQGL